jgi:peptidoglycan biosynthesis protein MviN/MurJ (putative lipid II flippase)
MSKSTGAAAVGGLALSSSLVYTIAFVLLLILLIKKIGRLQFKLFWGNIIRKVIFGLIMGAFMYLLFKMWDEVLNTALTINVLILTISTIIPGISIYLWLSYIFRDPEISIVGKVVNIFFKQIKQLIKRS